MWNRDAAVRNEPPQPDASLAQPDGPRRPDERRLVAWVGPSVKFTGTLVSSEDMTIDGDVEGSIEVREHALTVGPHAHLQAEIMAAVVIVYGHVVGNIRATAKIDISETGRVEGSVTAARVALAPGAIVQGRVSTEAVSAATGGPAA
jgi:cytoskeletal protein CcmA (bactofilin family)